MSAKETKASSVIFDDILAENFTDGNEPNDQASYFTFF
jgi:hypothetical protein